MAEYKIEKVSTQKPREYFNEKYNTTTYYIIVMLEGHPKPVSIGKRSPDALKPGGTVNGTILPTEYKVDNFKAERPSTPFQAKDQDSIRAQWAIGQAVQLYIAHSKEGIDTMAFIEGRASEFFLMVGRVKNSGPITQESVKEVFKAPAKDSVTTDFDEEAPINLDDIPF